MLKSKRDELMRQRENALKNRLQREVTETLDRMVDNEIDTICSKTLMRHIEPLERPSANTKGKGAVANNLNYQV